MGENSGTVPADVLSPELALVDPELADRARARLPDPRPFARQLRPVPVQPASAPSAHRPYPFWARVTAALWLLVLGMMIGGAAIPHAQDTPRVIPTPEDPAFCPAPAEPSRPGA